MLNEVRLIGRVNNPIPARAGPVNGYSFTVWAGILIRVSVPREIGPRLQAMLLRGTLVWVQGELSIGGSVWATRVVVLADAKIRHLGKAVEMPAAGPEAARSDEFALPPRGEGPALSPDDPGQDNDLWEPCPSCSRPKISCKCPAPRPAA